MPYLIEMTTNKNYVLRLVKNQRILELSVLCPIL